MKSPVQSVVSKSLLGACAAALLAGGAVIAQTTSDTAGQAQDTAQQEQPQAQPTAEAPAQPAEGTAASDAEGGDLAASTVVASVAGTDITLGELIAARRSLPDEFQQLPDEVLMDALVEQIANQILLETAAKEAGLDQKPAVQLALRNQARAVLASAYMEQAIGQRVSDEAVQAAYEAAISSAEPVEEAHAAHILVEDEALAEEIKTKLDEGADFAALAAEHGTDGTASRGGDLGWFVHEQMVPQFADAVFAMEADTISDPVQTPFGWHVIKLFEKRERAQPTLDDVRDEIASQLAEGAQSEVLTEVREGVEVERDRKAVPASAIRADDLVAE